MRTVAPPLPLSAPAPTRLTRTRPGAARRGAVIEKYTRNTRFCLICNYVSKIIPALQSRCTRFRFPPLPHDCIRDRLNHIAQAENLKVDEGGVEAIIAISMGDMRKCVNILQVSCVPTAVFPRFASCVDGRYREMRRRTSVARPT